jgi:ribosome-associated translation inhibitor RaiA
MHLEVTFRNLNPRDEIRRRAQALYDKLDHFLEQAATGHMIVGIDHGAAIVELVVTTRGQTYTVKEEDPDLRAALDRAMHSAENQLRRAKELRTNRRARGEEEDGFVPEGTEGEADASPA